MVPSRSRIPARRPSRLRLVVALLVLTASTVATTVVARVPGTQAAFVTTVTDSTSTAASNGYFTCRTAAFGEAGTRAVMALPLTDASGPTAADVSGNGYNGTYTSSGVTYRQPGPCPRDTPASKAARFDGTAGINGPVGLYGGPNVFSIELWFTTTTAAGKLAGFGSSATGASVNADRHLYISSTGRLVFGVKPAAYQVVSSPASVVDGQWHHAAATLSAAGMRLYLDGALVASDPAVTSAQAFSGYVRLAYDSLAGWPNRPSSDYFTGSMAFTSVYLYALTAAQVKSHYLAGR